MGINKDQIQLPDLDVDSASRAGQNRAKQSLMKTGDDLQIDIADNLGSMKSPFSMNQRELEMGEDEDQELRIINPSTPGSAVYIHRKPESTVTTGHGDGDGDGDPNHNEVGAGAENTDGFCVEQSTMSDYQRQKLLVPEKKLTLFAMRLALLEKIASNVGTLGFIWATVVILGGYAITLKEVDFWVVTIILIIEGTRIFMRSHELEWQHQDSGDAGVTVVGKAYRAIERVFSNLMSSEARLRQNSEQQHHHLRRAWSNSAEVSLVPFMGLLFKAKRISFVLYSLQIVSALGSIGLSVWRLVNHDFVRETEVDTQNNHKAALLIFYSLTVAEAAVFLAERAYWQFQVSVRKLLQRTNSDCKLKDKDCYTVRRFFYDVYEKCLTQSVFDGLKMDMVDYALQWTQSDVLAEQLHGVKALVAFSSDAEKQMKEETLRTISTRPGAVERLLEMVTWKNEEEQEVREKAALLLRILVGHDRTALRVASVAGAVEAIFTLLYDDSIVEGYRAASAHEYAPQNALNRLASRPRASSHVRAGLHILINMAKNPINCAKIGATRGLLPCLVSFIDVTRQAGAAELVARDEETVLALSLRLLCLLAACQGSPGKTLRAQIASVLPSITNLRNILNMHPPNPHLQKLAAATLSHLAMDIEVGQIIGRVGGVMRSLFSLFLKPDVESEITAPPPPTPLTPSMAIEQRMKNKEMKVAIKAGHALSLLALRDKENCARMLKLKLPATASDVGVAVYSPAAAAAMPLVRRDVIDGLVGILRDRHRGYVATFILYCFCDTGAIDHHHKDRVAKFFPEVMRLFMEKEEKVQEAAIGLVAKILKGTKTGYKEELLLCDGKYSKNQVVDKIAHLLETHKLPSLRLPRLRRFCLELINILIELDPSSFIPLFESNNLVGHLDCIAATASDMENYAAFSGGIGTIFLPNTMEHLVQETIEKLSLHDQISFS